MANSLAIELRMRAAIAVLFTPHTVDGLKWLNVEGKFCSKHAAPKAALMPLGFGVALGRIRSCKSPADQSILSPTYRTPVNPFVPGCAGKVYCYFLILRSSSCACVGVGQRGVYLNRRRDRQKMGTSGFRNNGTRAGTRVSGVLAERTESHAIIRRRCSRSFPVVF